MERANAEQTLGVFASSAEYIPQCQVRCDTNDRIVDEHRNVPKNVR